jgi:alpha-1,2-mannosyltransferase
MDRRAAPLAAIAAGIALDVGASALLARAMGPANDLFPRWFGTRAWLLEGINPYATAVDDGIRAAMGGAPGTAPGDSAFVFGFVYPGYVALLLAPLALLPFGAAAVVWLLLAQAAVVAGAWWCWRACEVERGWRPVGMLAGIGAAVLFPASLLNLAFGQFAALVFAALAACWYLAVRGRDGPAGAVLALALVKPSLAALPVAAILTWAAAARRGRLIAAWLGAAATLVVPSLMLLPSWPADFVRSTTAYARVASATSASALLAAIIQRAPSPYPTNTWLWITIAAASTAAAGAWWAGSRRGLGHALAAGALAGAWLVPPLYEWNSVVLLVWLVPAVRAARRAGPASRWLVAGGLLVAYAATLLAIWRWPSESRVLWPCGLLVWCAAAGIRRYRGTYRRTLRASTSPSSPATT